jgi:oxygen-dependent protoporphyrinogen oxidase
MPRYHVGHLALAARVEAELATLPGVHLAGNSVRGVGIPDAIASGERAADEALGPPKRSPAA